MLHNGNIVLEHKILIKDDRMKNELTSRRGHSLTRHMCMRADERGACRPSSGSEGGSNASTVLSRSFQSRDFGAQRDCCCFIVARVTSGTIRVRVPRVIVDGGCRATHGPKLWRVEPFSNSALRGSQLRAFKKSRPQSIQSSYECSDHRIKQNQVVISELRSYLDPARDEVVRGGEYELLGTGGLRGSQDHLPSSSSIWAGQDELLLGGSGGVHCVSALDLCTPKNNSSQPQSQGYLPCSEDHHPSHLAPKPFCSHYDDMILMNTSPSSDQPSGIRDPSLKSGLEMKTSSKPSAPTSRTQKPTYDQ
eukprot:bmy_16388T0